MKVTHTPPVIAQTQQVAKQTEQLSSWQKMINGIVRPPRSKCADPLKGVKNFRMNQSTYHRSDFTVIHEQKKIDLTVFDPDYKCGWVVLYLHGNSSSKVEAYSIREYLPLKYSLAAFDFMGCGQNYQQDTVTLGYRESQQVATVVTFLKEKGYKVILWGRSMGAATALRYGKASVIVADSAFKSFKSLCKQVAKKNAPCFLPNCLISCLFPCVYCKIRSDVEEKGEYDVDCLDTTESVKSISPGTLVVFLSGDDDTLIDKRNSQKLFAMFAGPHKHLEIFKGTHNTKRPPQVIKRVMEKIQAHIRSMENAAQKVNSHEHFKDLT